MSSRHLPRFAFASALFLSPVTIAAEAPPQLPDTPEPVFHCGKAQALARLHRPDASEPLPARFLDGLNDTDLLHNEIDIEISNINPGANTCQISGSNRMTIQSKSPALLEFTFRLRDQYTITSAVVNEFIPVPVASISTTTRVVDLSGVPPIGMDDEFTLTIHYDGMSYSAGFGSIEVSTHSGGIPVVATLSEAYYAYTWWPTKDGDVFEPGDNSDKATLDFAITVPDTYDAPANGLLIDTQTLTGNRVRYQWQSNYPISTYLVAFGATEYNTWTAYYDHPGGSMPVEFYIYPSLDFSSNRTAWERSIDMLHVFRPLFGEYPFIDEKYGIYNFPFGGGMEHQTITGQGGFGERLTAHELAHQWWGDMITCKTWSDIWLNEGFATYGECLWEEFENGSSNAAAYHACMDSERPFSVNGSCYVPPEDTDSMSRIFSTNFSYRKGAWVLHQLRHVLGDDMFFQVLADYRTTYAFSAASTDDFAAVASSTAGVDLTWFFDQWVYEIGAPSYEYGWTHTQINGQDLLLVHVEQNQSLSYPSVIIMPVDLVVTIGGFPQTRTVVNDARNEWFVLPVNGPVTNVAFDPDDWILRTGLSTQPYAPGPPKVVALSPAPGSLATPNVEQVTVWFQAPVDVSESDFILIGAQTGTIGFTIANTTGANPVVLDLDTPLMGDDYTLTISDSVVGATGQLSLDGETQNPADPDALPTGDGEPGGEAALSFSVLGLDEIPATSTWGMLAMAILVLVAGTLCYRKAHPDPIC